MTSVDSSRLREFAPDDGGRSKKAMASGAALTDPLARKFLHN
jgi:hypothetical protein